MNRYTKILRVMDVDAQNLPLDDFQDAEGMINFYMKKTDEEINAIYEDYYGKDGEEDSTYPKMKFLIVGEFEFPRDDVEELQDKTLIHRIDHIQFVPACRAEEIGERFLGDGYDSYIVLDDYDINSIHSPSNCDDKFHYWYAKADDGGYVVFNSHIEMMCGTFTKEEVFEHYGHYELVEIENQYREKKDQPVFEWKYFDQDNPYYEVYDKKVKAEAEEAAKKREELIYRLTEEIVENNELYQNLYQCTEAKKELLEDDQLWKEVMERVISFIQSQIEAIDKSSRKKVA